MKQTKKDPMCLAEAKDKFKNVDLAKMFKEGIVGDSVYGFKIIVTKNETNPQ